MVFLENQVTDPSKNRLSSSFSVILPLYGHGQTGLPAYTPIHYSLQADQVLTFNPITGNISGTGHISFPNLAWLQ
jgi:hypothetical protein